jgi:translation initiation factor 3 subunit L
VEINFFAEDPKSFMTQFGENPLYFKLGYFSLIGLLRLHVLLADYEQVRRNGVFF